MIHSHNYRVYYEDTDAGGIMYHARYINWCERARAEFLSNVGLTSSGIVDNDKIMFVVRHMDCHYHKPARLDEVLRVESQIKEMKNSSFIMNQSIFCQDSMLFSMTITLVCVDVVGARPIRMPDRIRQILENDQEGKA